MALVIGFESSHRRYQQALERGWDDSDPADVAFWLPDKARKGDRILYFVGGRFRYFVGHSYVESNVRTGRSGHWKGIEYWHTGPVRLLDTPVPGDDVTAATGFVVPLRSSVVPPEVERAVWKSARGRPLVQVERAMEGATSEARSRYRDPRLRQTALQLANGVCAACQVDYKKASHGLGRHCLVVHHTKQLKDSDQPRETKVSELAVLCANCHMMIHANPAKAMTVSQLRSKLRGTGRSR